METAIAQRVKETIPYIYQHADEMAQNCCSFEGNNIYLRFFSFFADMDEQSLAKRKEAQVGFEDIPYSSDPEVIANTEVDVLNDVTADWLWDRRFDLMVDVKLSEILLAQFSGISGTLRQVLQTLYYDTELPTEIASEYGMGLRIRYPITQMVPPSTVIELASQLSEWLVESYKMNWPMWIVVAIFCLIFTSFVWWRALLGFLFFAVAAPILKILEGVMYRSLRNERK
jgi:hypothetical protein